MNRPTLEVADIVRASGNSSWEHYGSHLAWQHRKVLDAIVRCRTAALGAHHDQCTRCGYQAISYNSCRNRHCPRCQGNARSRWLAQRRAELLPVSYFHIVFTLPHELSALALQNKRLLYDLLFRASAATLLELAGDPKHLGARHRVSWRAPHLGTEPSPSSAHTLHCSGWRSCTRWFPMDLFLETILPACRRAESRLPGHNFFFRTSSSFTAHSRVLLSHVAFAGFSDSSSTKTGSSMPSHPSAVPSMF